MVVVELFAIGLIFYWQTEELAPSPGPEDATPDSVAPPAAEGESTVQGDGTVLPAPMTGDSTPSAPVAPAD